MAPGDLAWRVIGLLNLYRLLIPPTLLGIQWFTQPQPSVGGAHPRLFLFVCVAYLLAAVALIVSRRQRWYAPSLRALALTHAAVDALAIALFLYASGGVASGLGILLVVPVASTALLTSTRDGLLIAAVMALGVLIQQVLSQLGDVASSLAYPNAGVVGAVLFLTVLAVWPIANRLRESEALVKRQEVDLANMAQLSQYIVQHLRESILVVDAEDRIRLINESAAFILGDRLAYPGALLGEASPKLLYLLETWRQSGTSSRNTGATFVAADGALEIAPHFAPLGTGEEPPVLIFLEDTSLLAARVQQSKLASLGRLSASIAHEIRNPVGAMSHAAQLLAESATLAEPDRRMTEIMRSNADRVSNIIDNVLAMSRREATRPERLDLTSWLDDFLGEFEATMQLGDAEVTFDPSDDRLEVLCDPSHLRRVVWNLCDNALKHGAPSPKQAAAIELRVGRLPTTARPYLEVCDRGPGIPQNLAQRIFEPFFTGEARGTGLGLFLSRELAQTNGATLLHEPRAGGGTVFRLVFADPLRWEA